MIKEIVYSEFIEEVPAIRDWVDSSGREVLSRKPVAIPLQYFTPPSSMAQLIHQLYVSMRDTNPELESPEDADDFDVPDELGIEMRSTPYEMDFDHISESSAPATEPPAVPEQLEKVTE